MQTHHSIDRQMEDTKYHCSHLKVMGFLLSWTFLNTILSPSVKASSLSSYLNPVVWLERPHWYDLIALSQHESRIGQIAHERQAKKTTNLWKVQIAAQFV